jgi:hypothetical protein
VARSSVCAANSLGELKMKLDAYLAAGTLEGWLVLESLDVRFFDRDGERERSRFEVDLSGWRGELG